MEFNVKNCLGPGNGNSIAEEFTLQTAWFDDHVFIVDDAAFGYTPPNSNGPTVIYNPPGLEEEHEWVEKRINQLEELQNLRGPIDMSYCEGGAQCNWTAEDHAAYDAWCAGEPDSYNDLMGLHHGRNE